MIAAKAARWEISIALCEDRGGVFGDGKIHRDANAFRIVVDCEGGFVLMEEGEAAAEAVDLITGDVPLWSGARPGRTGCELPAQSSPGVGRGHITSA